jgi:hypothetical protein
VKTSVGLSGAEEEHVRSLLRKLKARLRARRLDPWRFGHDKHHSAWDNRLGADELAEIITSGEIKLVRSPEASDADPN